MSVLVTLACAIYAVTIARQLQHRRLKVMAWCVVALELILAAILASMPAQAANVPPAAHTWQRTIIREAHAVWGLQAPVALFGAQVHQESHWQPEARSPYAAGLAQFTTATAADMARWYPELGPADVYNPQWAIRALIRYDHRLYAGLKGTATDCDRWAMTLAAHNGGLGWIHRDRALCRSVSGCDPARWWGHVEQQTQRAAWAHQENRAYPRRILYALQPRYARARWPGEVVCHD